MRDRMIPRYTREERARYLLPVDDGQTREEWEAENRRIAIRVAGFVMLLFASAGLGVLTAKMRNAEYERITGHNSIPTSIRQYDFDKDGILNRAELSKLFLDYDFTKKLQDYPPITKFN